MMRAITVLEREIGQIIIERARRMLHLVPVPDSSKPSQRETTRVLPRYSTTVRTTKTTTQREEELLTATECE